METEEVHNETHEPDGLSPDTIDKVDHTQCCDPLAPQRPGQAEHSLAHVNKNQRTDKKHKATDGIDPEHATPRAPQAAQTGKGQGKCKLGCYQARHSTQATTVYQQISTQPDQISNINTHMPLDAHTTPPFRGYGQATYSQPFPDRDACRLGKCDPSVTKHGQAIKGQKLPKWELSGPAKYKTWESTECSPEDEDRGL